MRLGLIAYISVPENPCGKSVAYSSPSLQNRRKITASLNADFNILCGLTDLSRIICIVTGHKTHNAGCHGGGINFNSRTIDTVQYLHGKALRCSFIFCLISSNISQNTGTVIGTAFDDPILSICPVFAVQIPIVFTADNIIMIPFIGMVELRHNAAGSAQPALFPCGLQIAVIIAALQSAAGSGPLSQNTSRIVGVQTINRSVICAIFYFPLTLCCIILVSDNPAGKAVGIDITDLSAHKCFVHQKGQILLRFVHTDNPAGTHTDGIGFIVQIPVARGAIVHRAGGRIVRRNPAGIAIVGQNHGHASVGVYSASLPGIGQIFQFNVFPAPGHITSILSLPAGFVQHGRRGFYPLGAADPAVASHSAFQQRGHHHVFVPGQLDHAFVVTGDPTGHAVGNHNFCFFRFASFYHTANNLAADSRPAFVHIPLVLSADTAHMGRKRLFLRRGTDTGGSIDSSPDIKHG